MGSVDRCDPTLPLNEMIYYVRKDAVLRARWNATRGLAREFGLGPEELAALRAKDVGAARARRETVRRAEAPRLSRARPTPTATCPRGRTARLPEESARALAATSATSGRLSQGTSFGMAMTHSGSPGVQPRPRADQARRGRDRRCASASRRRAGRHVGSATTTC